MNVRQAVTDFDVFLRLEARLAISGFASSSDRSP